MTNQNKTNIQYDIKAVCIIFVIAVICGLLRYDGLCVFFGLALVGGGIEEKLSQMIKVLSNKES